MSFREKVVYGLALFALLGVVADNVANEGKYTKPVKDKLEKVYEKIVKKTPAVVIAADSPAPTPAPTVAANGSAKETANPFEDYYKEVRDANGVIHKITMHVQKDIAKNFTKMLDVMEKRTPERYSEIAPFLNGTTIVLSKENYNYYGSGDKIGLVDVVINGGGSDDVKVQLGADAFFYAEARAAKLSKGGEIRQFKNYYEHELFQHSNNAKYRVEAGIDTKENMNAWLKQGGWFKAIEGRYPTADDLEGVDIEQYLIK